jgi:hypothetical protein
VPGKILLGGNGAPLQDISLALPTTDVVQYIEHKEHATSSHNSFVFSRGIVPHN